MRNIADIMGHLTEMAETTGTRQIRKTRESPPRVSTLDVMSLITGHEPNVCSVTARQLQKAHPSLAICDKAKLPGQVNKSYVCKVEQLEQLLVLLPGKGAAEFRATGKRRKKEPHDLYVMKYSNDDTCVKIGRSECVEKRRRGLESGQNFYVEVVAIFPGKGHLEQENSSSTRARRGQAENGSTFLPPTPRSCAAAR
jgi:hypothetical protein